MTRIQRKRTKGWRMPEGVVSVTRPGPWGNPFTPARCLEFGYASTEGDARMLCVLAFEHWLLKGDLSEWWVLGDKKRWLWMRQNLHTLDGKTLACWCPLDQPCHADVLAKWAKVADWGVHV